MKECMSRPYQLADKLSRLYDLNGKMDSVLSVSMYYLCQFLDSERSSIFLFQPSDQHLTIFSSLDLKRHEIHMPTSCGVSGWVFENRKPALINNAYEDERFYKKVDQMTGFHTSNLICTPLFDSNETCLGTLQSLNKRSGDFTTDDLDLLNLAARMVAIAISNSRRYRETLVTNEARRKMIYQMTNNLGFQASSVVG